MKKKFSIFTIVFVIISALLSIIALFGLVKFSQISNLLWTSLTLTVSGLLAINSCVMLEKKNKLAIVSLLLICASALLAIIAFWFDIPGFYSELTLTVCILSVCFNIIISYILKINNSYLYLQLPTYICLALISIFLIATVWGSSLLANALKIFILLIILAFVGICVLSVISKKYSANESMVDYKKYVKITKEEYEDLLAKKDELERLLSYKND